MARAPRSPDVRFDNYTLFIKGQRVFLNSGEFHTFRLPVPSLWPDILEKAKAAGLNSVSVYLHMGLINPYPGVVDFAGFRAIQPLYEAAKAAGIWIVLRPGPYINAETTAGGIAHWVTSEVAGTLRTNDSDWRDAWQDYIQGVIEQTAPYLISSGGPVIDNEYSDLKLPARVGYFQDLIDIYRNSSSIDVPLTYNDYGSGRSFLTRTGAVDLYSTDSYPQGFDCSNPLRWRPVPTTYHQHHQEVNPLQPWYFPEFQGGSFDAWGPTAPGYDACRVLTGPAFMSVFNLQLWASNAKLINYYMFYGGTSWGGLPFPGVYTSYDYGASVTESRELTPKFDELKRQAFFLRSSPEFYKTDWIADSATGLKVSDNSEVYTTLLKNPDVAAAFYVVRHRDSTSNTSTTFRLNIATSVGVVQLPRTIDAFRLGGRESKVIVTDYTVGASSTLLYASTHIFYSGVIDGRDVLFVYGDPSQEYELAIFPTGTPNNLTSPSSKSVKISENYSEFIDANGRSPMIVTLLAGIEGLVTVRDSDTQLILFADTATAGTFWSPVIAGPEDDPFRNFWGIGTNQSILVGGPYLVRNATIVGDVLALRGDLKNDVALTVIASKNITSLTWNGRVITPDLQVSSGVSAIGGVFVGSLKSKASLLEGPSIPKLSGWKYKDSLPEIRSGYNDSTWSVADHTSTNIPYKPYYGDGRVLYGCDYRSCENAVLWRIHFLATGTEKSVNLSINGGEAFAASVWLNEVFLGTSFGNSTNNRNIIEETDQKFTFPEGALLPNQDNVITIVQDNMGLNEAKDANAVKGPRGIRGFKLSDGTFGVWKVQGKEGGYINFPDKTRGVLNEGGLHGERYGWHVPEFVQEGWVERDISSGLPDRAAGVGFFVTTFKLDIAEGLDAMFSFNFNEPFGQPYRALLFVNGWNMGTRIGNLGPQSKFPVHEGILNYRGENTVAVALWVMIPNVTVSLDLQLALDAIYDGGVGNVELNNPHWYPDLRPL